MLIDSHCHLDCLNLEKYNGELQQALEAAQANDVAYFLCVSINLIDLSRVLTIAETYPNVYASVGLHPNETAEQEPNTDALIELAQHPKVIAIGETGLDYYRSEGDLEWQRDRFRAHIRAAHATQKPLIIHSRDANDDTIKIMREEKADTVGGVMHCFTGPWDMAQQALDLNFYISFSGIVTFKNARELQETARKVPFDRMLIETDSPYLAPVPFRGKTNEPAYVKHVAEFIADLREVDYEVVAEQTTENFVRLFGVPLT